jgi:hypothetical protein
MNLCERIFLYILIFMVICCIILYEYVVFVLLCSVSLISSVSLLLFFLRKMYIMYVCNKFYSGEDDSLLLTEYVIGSPFQIFSF